MLFFKSFCIDFIFAIFLHQDNAWDGETKVHGVDDIFEQNQSNNPLSKSLPVPGNVSKKGKCKQDLNFAIISLSQCNIMF